MGGLTLLTNNANIEHAYACSARLSTDYFKIITSL